MIRTLRTIALLLVAALLGAGAGELIFRSTALHAIAARWAALQPGAGALEPKLREASRDQAVTDAEIDRELNLRRAQFENESAFTEALVSSGYSLGELRTEAADHLRALHWIEQSIAPELRVTEDEANQFYETHREQFAQPERRRANHLFRAAPDGAAADVVAAQQSAIIGLAVRLLAGEAFAQLASEASEDEATKLRGGYLNYFAAARMPPEFMAEVEKLKTGQLSGPFKTHLGFHVVQLTDLKPPGELTFEQARSEILLRLANEKRQAAVARLGDAFVASR
jgi:parvulin-like peptidyl-prolyl isomerase